MNPRSIVRVVMLAGLASCRAETWSPAVPERIEVIQGAAQRGTPGIPLDTLILARVVDGNGNSVSGVPISWEVLGGAGSVDPVEGETPDDLAGAVWTP